MAEYFSLAQHLQRAAGEYPALPALLNAGKTWSFKAWLAESHTLSEQIEYSPLPLIKADDSLHLARHAYACSLKNRPFWPFAPRTNSCISHRNASPDLNQQSKYFPDATSMPPDVALIISTSGSAGRSRAVLLGDAQLDSAAAASNQCLPLGPGDLWLNCLPLYHIGGQAILWRCARAMAGVLLHQGFNVEAVANDLRQYPVTHISLVPAMLAQLIERQIKAPSGLCVTLIGGAALSRPLYDKAINLGWPLYPSYGMSETSAQLATFKPGDGVWHEGLVGRPMPNHEIRINPDGRIAVRGPQVMLGYLQGGGVDYAGWLTTDDLGSLDSNACLTVTGRADDMLISGGRNVHPLEVESCLAACPGVSDVAVTGLPDPIWGDLIVALIVGTTGQSALLAHARQHLPTAALPRKFVFLESLPRNAAGKLDRIVLRHLASGSAA